MLINQVLDATKMGGPMPSLMKPFYDDDDDDNMMMTKTPSVSLTVMVYLTSFCINTDNINVSKL